MIKQGSRILAKKKRFAKNIFSQALGLMFSTKKEDEGLIFVFRNEQKIGLHMFFVFYSIDILVLDKKKKVVEIKRNFKPFTFYSPKHHGKYLLELPLGKARGIKLKQKISF